MSKIYKRPMFRGGGKVSSYGNGIASGLADGGRVDLGFGGALKGGLGTSNYSGGQTGTGAGRGLTKGTRTARLLSQMRGLGGLPSLSTSALMAAPFALPAGLAYANRPETLEEKKVMQDYGPIDETFFDYDKYYADREEASKIGDKINMSDALFMDPESGTYPKMFGRTEDRDKLAAIAAAETEKKVGEEVEGDGKTDTERRLEMEKNALKELLDSFGGGSKKEDTEDEALAAIEKKQKLLEKVMGGGKDAIIQDVSDMALSFAGKAFKEGATTKSAFGEFFEEESKRPSRSQKVKDAAANAAIQAYLTEKISEKDFSKQMALITGQAQIKQKFADAAVANLTVQDYVRLKGSNTSKSEAIEDGARGIVQNNPKKYKGFTKIESKDNIPGLLIEANLGEVFLDQKTREVFAVIILEDGTVGKEILYN